MSSGFPWPNNCRAAVSITMDNLGEASDLLRGTWPEGEPLGHHFSVVSALPLMLEILADHQVHATYFIEALNTEMYPAAITSVRDSGHEVAFHGWQHEPWSELDAATERELVERSRLGFERLGLKVVGFRPPGGKLTDSSSAILRESGFTYCSPAGIDPAWRDGIVYLPFDWQGIDAYYYSEGFAGLRVAKGDSEAPMSPGEFAQRAIDLVDHRIATGGYTALLFHPFLEHGPERIDAMHEILRRVTGDPGIWCAPGYQVAEWVRDRRETFPGDPRLDLATWAR